jgi:dTDP-4-amino-4,6-dideoxygalactose transaminase
MSGLSRLVLAQCNIQEAIEKRRANYLTLLSRCSAIPHCLPMFPILPSDTCPWIFPFTVQGEDLHVRLRERGIPATTWGGVIHPSLSLSEFPDAEFLYRKVIMLPVHQDLTERDLDLMVRSVRDVIRQYAIRSAVA